MPPVSAGLVLLKNRKILLVHPTDARAKGTYGIPKGHVESGESLLDAAIRETFEEVGIRVQPSQISSGPHEVIYRNTNGKVRKKVYYFIVDATHLNLPDDIPAEQLQTSEVDWAGFVDKSKAKELIFWRFKELLNLLR